MSTAIKASEAVTTAPSTLPIDGMSRFKQFQRFCPVSREMWRQLVAAKKAPQPIKLSSTCVMYRNSDLHAFLADPVNYRVEVAA